MAAKKATPAKAAGYMALLQSCPRVLALVTRPESEYLGVCVVQAPAAWTRLGPTWVTPRGWVVVGRGLSRWGTTQGLAELAISTVPKIEWHAVGVAITPAPNVVFACTPEVIDHLGLAEDDVASATAKS